MSVFYTLVRRELASFFVSLTGYVVIAMVMFLFGLSFVQLITAFNTRPSDVPLTELFYSTVYFWLILLLATPVITMRSFALEKSTGTYEALMTTPVSDVQVVLAKFFGAWLFYFIMWLPLLGCLLLLKHYTSDPLALDTGTLLSTYLGIGLLGCVYVSFGCFASALTRSQIIAAMLSFAMGMALFLLSFLHLSLPDKNAWMTHVLAQVSVLEHMQDFVRGVVDTRYLVFYASVTVFFLFLNCKVVESRRWK